MLFLYNMFIRIALVIGLPVLLPYMLLSPKRRQTLLYKLGWKVPPTLSENGIQKMGNGQRVWIHALSVGEVIAVKPLVSELKRRLIGNILFSASTLTGYDIACKQLKDQVAGIFYSPYDMRSAVNRTLDRIRPSLTVIVETDTWPNMISNLRDRNIPVLLVNARLSDRSLKGYRRFNFITSILFRQLNKICVQSDADAHRYVQLGVPEGNLIVTGNLKFDQSYPSLSETEIADLKNNLGINPEARIIVAGSTHEGEEEIVGAAFSRLRNEYPNLVLINAPRDPNRSDHISQQYTVAGLKPCLLSEINPLKTDKSVNVIIIDAIGMLVRLYAISDISIIGGSLLDIRGIGGHNPLEPAAFAKPVIFGENMRNFRQIASLLKSAGSILKATDADQLTVSLRSLLDDRKLANRTGQKAYQVFSANKGAVTMTVDQVLQHLEDNARREAPE